jgi:hypothetical protein
MHWRHLFYFKQSIMHRLALRGRGGVLSPVADALEAEGVATSFYFILFQKKDITHRLALCGRGRVLPPVADALEAEGVAALWQNPEPPLRQARLGVHHLQANCALEVAARLQRLRAQLLLLAHQHVLVALPHAAKSYQHRIHIKNVLQHVLAALPHAAKSYQERVSFY